MTFSSLWPARLAAALLAILALGAAGAAAQSVEERVEGLLGRMTLEEKVGQLNLVSLGPQFPWEEIETGRIGSLINFNAAPDIARAQELARRSRLGIPPLFGLDVLHGFRTIFPVPLAETATFNPELARLASEWAAREAVFIGVNWTYAPMADVAKDPRWGRIVEGSGEDPHLGQVFTAARVQGFRAGGLATSVKHFAGYGAPVGGRDYDTTLIPLTELRDTYLPPFRAAIGAGAETVMSAFNALNGVPSTANPFLLTDVLRREWGFDGFVVSDWGAVQELVNHGIAADGAEAARKALLSGVDMDMMGGLYDRHLADEVRAGRVPVAAIDEAVRRVLRVKFRLGLFERPTVDPTRTEAGFPSPQSRAVARAVARESMVLLTNRGDLPVAPAIRSVAVVGPLADAPRDPLGPHAARGHDGDTVTILEGLRRRAGADIRVSHAPGCDLFCTSEAGIPAAVEAAREADLVVAVVGEPQDLSGEAATRAHLKPAGFQPALLEALLATGKPVVIVLVAGRPLELGPYVDRAAAILMAWYPGTEGGSAVADLLFGDAEPSGRLPLAYPRAVGQLPLPYERLPTGRPHLPSNRFTLGYLDERLSPLFPFGHGLGYTRFAYEDVKIETPQVAASGTVQVTATLRNVGARPGSEVAQLYLRQPVASRSRPLRQLKAFQKVHLQPGEARRVALHVPARDLGYHLDDGTYVVEAGAFEAYLGGNSEAPLGGRFEVTEGLRIPPE